MIATTLVVVSLFGGACSTEQPTPAPQEAATAEPVTVGEVVPVRVSVGSATSVRVPVEVASGFRVQANPASNEFLVPVDLEIEAVDGIEFGDPVYPKGQPYRLQGTDEDLSTYQGDIEIVVAVTATEAAPVGRRDIHGELRFQACNSQVCLFPASVAVTLSIDIDPAE
jgi:hypothetical protein